MVLPSLVLVIVYIMPRSVSKVAACKAKVAAKTIPDT